MRFSFDNQCRSKLLELYLITKGLNNLMTTVSPWNIAVCSPATPVCAVNSTSTVAAQMTTAQPAVAAVWHQFHRSLTAPVSTVQFEP
jgi:beta-lactamase class A